MKHLTELLFIFETSCCGYHGNIKPSGKRLLVGLHAATFCPGLMGELPVHGPGAWEDFLALLNSVVQGIYVVGT